MNTRTLVLAVAAFAASTASADPTIVGFDGGDPSGFEGNAFFEANGGNPDGNAHHVNDSFGQELRTGGPGNPVNSAFLGNYGQYASIDLALDVHVEFINDFIGNPIIREIGVMLIDHDTVGPDGPAGVFYNMGLISANHNPDWTTLAFTIDDTASATIPAGWVGFGDTNASFEPVLPAGASFASVLADVDEFRITTFVPGFFYTNSFWDMRIDNVSINKVPAPGAMALLSVGALATTRRRRA